MIVHQVLFELHDGNDAPEAVQRLRAMAGRIPGLVGLHAGTNVADSPFDVGLVTLHDDADALDTYRTHPVHVEVIEWLRPRIAERAAADFETPSS